MKNKIFSISLAAFVSIFIWSISLSSCRSGNKADPSELKKVLEEGFEFCEKDFPFCKIEGSDGKCSVEAFVMPESSNDQTGWTCKKLDKASYQGDCVGGFLEGVVLVYAKGTKKRGPQAFVAYFHKGKMMYPALTGRLEGHPFIGVKNKMSSSGCEYFGKWEDWSRDECALIQRAFGHNATTQSAAEDFQKGVFNIDETRKHFYNWLNRSKRVSKSPFIGTWQGSLTEHGKTTHIKFDFQDSDDNTKGTITILSQTGGDVNKGMSFEIMNIEKTNQQLKFIVPITGKVDRDSLIFSLTLNDNQLVGHVKENREDVDILNVSFIKNR